ncbi:MAG: FRG domain-containing protein [Deltaproteobacteria bacterium]|nr:FRG domain-containing protein [Deltaproteobacteria bacterium]
MGKVIEGKKIECLEDFVKALNFYRKSRGIPWWRGQGISKWGLIPTLFRENNSDNEFELNITFKRQARVRYEKCPDENDRTSWLFLMRHYGLPSRLLDWSESPLTALFFAVEDEKDDSDGALWSINPGELNEVFSGINPKGIFDCHDERVTKVIKDIPLSVSDKYLPPAGKKVLAIMSEHFDLRHLLQQAVFTLHESDMDLDKHEKADLFLIKFIIPAGAKSDLRRSLHYLGINRSTLFPDLDNLSTHLNQMKWV